MLLPIFRGADYLMLYRHFTCINFQPTLYTLFSQPSNQITKNQPTINQSTSLLILNWDCFVNYSWECDSKYFIFVDLLLLLILIFLSSSSCVVKFCNYINLVRFGSKCRGLSWSAQGYAVKPLSNGTWEKRETCLSRKTFTAPRVWTPEDQNFKYPYETEPACNGGKTFGPLRFRYCQVSLYWCGIQTA